MGGGLDGRDGGCKLHRSVERRDEGEGEDLAAKAKNGRAFFSS